jgi:hypothetical protein
MTFLQTNRPFAQNSFCAPESLSYSILNAPMLHYGSNPATYQTKTYYGHEVLTNPMGPNPTVKKEPLQTELQGKMQLEEPSLPKAPQPPIEWVLFFVAN